MKVTKEGIKIYGLLLIYKLFLELIYINIIVPMFGYTGFKYEPSTIRYAVSWFILLFSGSFAKRLYNNISFSDTIIWLLYLLCFVPAITMFGLCETPFIVYFIVYWIVLAFANKIIPPIKIEFVNRKSLSESGIVFIAVLMVLLNFYIWARYAHFHLQLSFSDVYDLRMEARSYSMPSVLSYLFYMVKECIPMLMVWSFLTRRRMSAILLLLAQIFSFFSNGSKAAIFSIALALISFIVLHNKKEKSTGFMLIGCTGIAIIGFLEKIFFSSFYIILFVIRRLMFLPQLLNYYFYDYFSSHINDWFRESLFGKIGFASPYPEGIAYLIGREYLGNAKTSANNGLFADAFANCGVLGVIIGPILLVFLLRMLDWSSKGLSENIIIAPIVTMTIVIISSSYFTIWITHGGLLMCLILYFIPRHAGCIKKS